MQISTDTTYPIIRNKPVAKFRYKGSHTKPVRRTVLLTEVRRDLIRGYELREGNDVRDIDAMICHDDEVIKSFSRDKIVDFERFSVSGCSTL